KNRRGLATEDCHPEPRGFTDYNSNGRLGGFGSATLVSTSLVRVRLMREATLSLVGEWERSKVAQNAIDKIKKSPEPGQNSQ
ncbi:MAG: hypothetical protein WCQ57_14975, partial [Verrucomicrobiota bacterium]